MPKLKEVENTMKFNTREFLEELLSILEEEYPRWEAIDIADNYYELKSYILEQAEYARDCKVID